MFETVQGMGFLLFIISMIVTAWLSYKFVLAQNRRLRDRVASFEGQVADLEDHVAKQDERYRRFYESVEAVTRDAAVKQLTTQQPLENPPVGVAPTLRELIATIDDTLAIPLGWVRSSLHAPPHVTVVSLDSTSDYFSGHIALAGETRHGKGTLLFLFMACLGLRNTPRDLQIFAIDPKRDFMLWKHKAHNWREPILGNDPPLIIAAFDALRAERERRESLRERHQVLEHHQLPAVVRPPLLFVAISEMDVIESAVPDLDARLAMELSTSLASGIIYLIDTQNNSGRKTRWRTHFTTLISGFQSSESSVQPNLGVRVDEIEKKGAIPPNRLPGKGYWTLRNGADVVTTRTPVISLEERGKVLASLPTALHPQSITIPAPALVRSTPHTSNTSNDDNADLARRITDEERAAIIASARTSTSRGDVSEAVFGRRRGTAYQKVKIVCDEHGLLVPNTDRESLSG